MPDNKRIDLSSDLDELNGDLLRDVREAAENEQKRQQEIKTRGSREFEKAQSKKQSIIIIAVAAVVIVGIAFWMVFKDSGSIDKVKMDSSQRERVVINQPNTVQPAQPANQTPAKTYSQGQSRNTPPPQTDYDQPSEDPGM